MIGETVTTHYNVDRIVEALGNNADKLLNHTSQTISKDLL